MIDLHSHTTASDGSLSPRELVQEAVRRGVRVLAITDHDSTEALGEAITEAAKHPPLEIVPGIELNTDVEGGEIHILGFFIDHYAEWFQVLLRELREERVQRIYRMAERLGELGLSIDPQEVFALVKEGSAGRPHVAQILVQHGYVKSVREAFDRYLKNGGPASVPRKKLSPQAAIDVIRRADGVAVFAHPGLSGKDELIPDLIRAGLQGIECYYHEHTPVQTATYLQLCKEHNLVATGGSDYHGPHLGRSNHLGSPSVPVAAYEALKAAKQRISGVS